MKFVLLSNQRSGSSLMARCLNSHPDIECRQEDLRRLESRNAEYLENIFSGNKKVKAFGFKLQYSQLNNEVWSWLKKNDIKIIQLIRRDMLETVLWWPNHVDIGTIKGGMGPPLVITKDQTNCRISRVVSSLAQLNKNVKRYRKEADLVLFYEDDLTNGGQHTDKFYNDYKRLKLLKLLGVRPVDLRDSETHQRKNVRRPSSEIVRNYSSLLKTIGNYDGFIQTYYKGD